MNRTILTLTAIVAFGTLVPVAPAAAADLSSVDCSNAAAMMMKPDDTAMAPASASMTADTAFDTMSSAMMHHGAMMAGVELKCGKNSASRAHAAALLKQLDSDGVEEAKDILNTYNH